MLQSNRIYQYLHRLFSHKGQRMYSLQFSNYQALLLYISLLLLETVEHSTLLKIEIAGLKIFNINWPSNFKYLMIYILLKLTFDIQESIGYQFHYNSHTLRHLYLYALQTNLKFHQPDCLYLPL